MQTFDAQKLITKLQATQRRQQSALDETNEHIETLRRMQSQQDIERAQPAKK